MLKKLVLSASAVSLVFAFGLGDIVGAASGGNAKTKGTNAQKQHSKCIPRMSGGSTSFTQMVAEKVLSLAIENALKSVEGAENIKIPARIKDTCEADKRLKYLQVLTKNFENNIANANEDILASVEQTKEIQTLQEEILHKKKSLSEAEYKDSVVEDNSKLLKLIKNAKVKDKAKYSAAMGKLAIATPINGYAAVAWDKEILEFAKDNMIWGLKNISSLKTMASQLTTTIKILPTLTKLTTSPLYNGRVDKKIAKRAAKASIKSDKKIAKSAESELDELDS